MESTSPNDSKRGYLNGDFAFFHLKDMKNISFEYHSHEFNKILIFLSGATTYLIEGKAYRLKPWDILFINGSEVHKPVIDPSIPYERMVIWVNPDFLERHSEECSLMSCFQMNSGPSGNLLRPEYSRQAEIASTLGRLEEAYKGKGFGSTILKNAIFLQLLVELTRDRLKTGKAEQIADITTDESMQSLLEHINGNLGSDLSVDALAAKCYLNRYHLMHKFKQQTGYSIHNYILQKRLIKADSLIRSGLTAAQSSEQCGFHDYSSFSRAYKKRFGVNPKKRMTSK